VILKCFFQEEALDYIDKEKTIQYISRVVTKLAGVGRSKAGVLLGLKFAKMGLTKTNRNINE